MPVRRFRPRATVEAIQFDGTSMNMFEITEWSGYNASLSFDRSHLHLGVPDGLDVPLGHWIIRGTTGLFFTCPAADFADNYEPEA